MFETLVKWNCFSRIFVFRPLGRQLLEKFYGCEIRCRDMDRTVRFAHHGRGCTVVAAKICAQVVIFQNVTVGTNMKFNKETGEWENLGTPILGKNVILADGAKVLGPVVIGEGSVVAAGAIVTKDVPPHSLAFGVNQVKPLDPRYDLVFNGRPLDPKMIVEANRQRVARYNELQGQ